MYNIFNKIPTYYIYDFVQFTNNNTDILVINGNANYCMDVCNMYNECLGFSKQKQTINNNTNCWLKRIINPNDKKFKKSNDIYETYIKSK